MLKTHRKGDEMIGIKVRLALAGLLGALALGAIGAPVAQAAGSTPCRVRNVTQDTAGRSLRKVAWAALDGDRLRLRGTCFGGVVIGNDLTITGWGDIAVVTGLGRLRVIRIRVGATVTLDHLHIVRGYGGWDGTRGGGGGIYNEGTLTLTDSIVRRAVVGEDLGGGITNLGTMTIRDSVVRENVADWGGGIYSRGVMAIVGSRVVANRGNPGGIASRGELTIIDSVVRGNARGGISLGGKADVTITGSRVVDNVGGGGVARHGVGTLTLDGSVISGNTSDYDGGGIATSGGHLVLLGTKITGNTAAGFGGGIFVSDGSTTVTLDATSSVTGNTPDDCHGTTAC